MKNRILFRVDGYKEIGMGQIYRCLAIAALFKDHEVMFVTTKKSVEGISVLHDSGINFSVIDSGEDIFNVISTWHPDIIVIDCLNSTSDYMKRIKSLVKRVIAIEDLGTGAKYADAVINALYEDKSDGVKFFSGSKFHCLREEFHNIGIPDFSESVKEIMITFGGADPSNLTKRLYNICKQIHEIYPKVHFTFVCGLVYDCSGNGIVSDNNLNITVLQNVHNISYYMKRSDIAVTSQGSTIFELASLGIPSISIAQNERELTHTFACEANGFLNLGLGKDLSDESIKNSIIILINNTDRRHCMRKLMLKNDIMSGTLRVADIILGKNDPE